ncbi:GmrSD restriction endonuclease domain-containing protein [Olleya namhaensis]|uniref:GmrSD restriction endonucleases N-terminal domain-containing protein n=1 Tax=Olleya namhaensis TaxID=1144750 RepID=A0A1I3QAY1_9FLAO|nr:DUF262 domain-containing protein [Olleya namhaensis]SFJ30749.1 Protein of unknown function DUF262 [Olleya namhaensis]
MKEDITELDIEDKIEDEEVYQTFDIATYPSDFTLKGIVNMWNEGGITIPDFQREFVWSIKQSSLLIESFLLGLPVPPVFFYIDEDNSNLVIDGQQRILSTVYFFNGYFGKENTKGKRQVFRLSGLNEQSPYHKKTYDDLSESDRRKLDNTVLRAINIRQLTPVGEGTSMYHIFERLNTGGTPLKSQEIRNVVFRGEFVNILRELNRDDNWRKILGTKSVNKHQTDVELLLRLFSLYTRKDEYEKPMKEFLNISMKKHQNGDTKEVKDFSEKFKTINSYLIKELGEKPFHLRTRLSSSTLDSVMVNLMQNINRIPTDFKNRYETLIKTEKLEELTTIGTTDPTVVKERFEFVNTSLFK